MRISAAVVHTDAVTVLLAAAAMSFKLSVGVGAAFHGLPMARSVPMSEVLPAASAAQ